MTHRTKKKLFTMLLFLFVIFNLTGCGCNHEWEEATCTEPKTCSICEKTKGKTLEHNCEWSEWHIDYDIASNVQELYCIQCNEVFETKTDPEPVATFIADDHFLIYPNAFANRFEDSSIRLENIDYCTTSEYNEYGFYD